MIPSSIHFFLVELLHEVCKGLRGCQVLGIKLRKTSVTRSLPQNMLAYRYVGQQNNIVMRSCGIVPTCAKCCATADKG